MRRNPLKKSKKSFEISVAMPKENFRIESLEDILKEFVGNSWKSIGKSSEGMFLIFSDWTSGKVSEEIPDPLFKEIHWVPKELSRDISKKISGNSFYFI